ncbi:MAG: phosphoribosyltransferase [Deltaproteobacteria bacterium]|nr:phosphoribosyltransferase [Deltaproteobacteria bacterium]
MKRAKVTEKEELRDRSEVFQDRWDAGEILAGMLKPEYGGRDDVHVLAIPAGGVPVGLKVREILNASFDLVIARKLKIPGNPEAGFGAMAYGGGRFLNEPLVSELRLDESDIEAETQVVQLELEKRNRLFREGRPFPNLSGRTVVLVDDGLASGYTMLSTLRMVRDQGGRSAVVAVPTAPQRTIDRLRTEADEIICPNIRTGMFFAVADAYVRWYDLQEQEVLDLLAEKASPGSGKPDRESVLSPVY